MRCSTAWAPRLVTGDADKRRAEIMHMNERDGVLFKITNDPRDLAAQHQQRFANAGIDRAVGREDAADVRYRHHERHGPTAQSTHDELHRVDRFEALRAARRADQTDHLVGEVRGIAIAEQFEPVECVLERAADRSVIERAAPQHALRREDGVGEGQRLVRRFDRGIVHRQVQLAHVEQTHLRAVPARAFERDPQRGKAARMLVIRTAQADDRKRTAHSLNEPAKPVRDALLLRFRADADGFSDREPSR